MGPGTHRTPTTRQGAPWSKTQGPQPHYSNLFTTSRTEGSQLHHSVGGCSAVAGYTDGGACPNAPLSQPGRFWYENYPEKVVRPHRGDKEDLKDIEHWLKKQKKHTTRTKTHFFYSITETYNKREGYSPLYIWYDLEQATKRLYRTSSTEKGALMEGAYLVELDFRKAATDKKIMPINCADFRSEESRQEYFQNCYVDVNRVKTQGIVLFYKGDRALFPYMNLLNLDGHVLGPLGDFIDLDDKDFRWLNKPEGVVAGLPKGSQPERMDSMDSLECPQDASSETKETIPPIDNAVHQDDEQEEDKGVAVGQHTGSQPKVDQVERTGSLEVAQVVPS